MKRYLLPTLLVGLLLACVSVVSALADTVTISDLTTLQAAIEGASGPRTIEIAAGTYTLAGNIDLDKPDITLQGQGSLATLIQVSGTGYRFSISANGCTIQNLDLLKTDNTSGQDIIWINASNTTIQNNRIHGQFVIGDGEVARAMVGSAGFSNLLVTGNTIYALRQPGYFSGGLTPSPMGTISSNFVYGTKGWVIEGGNFTFTGNTWGTGANANVFDVAILSGVQPAFYPDIVAMGAANNGAVIEDQRPSPRVLNIVQVDAAAAPGGTGGTRDPLQAIGPALSRAVAGGTIHVAAGTYAGPGGINSAVSLLGPNDGVCGHDAVRAGEAVINSGSPSIRVSTSAPVVISGFKFDGTGIAVDSYTTGSDVTFRDNIVVNTTSGAFFFANAAQLTYDCNYAANLHTDEEGMQLAGNWDGSTGSRATISNSVFENTTSTGLNISSTRLTLSGNRFTNVAYYAALIANNCGSSTISGNTFDTMVNPDTTVGTWGSGIRFYTPSNIGPVSITGNSFLNSFVGVGVRPSGGDITGQAISVTQNNFSGNQYDIRHDGVGTLAATCNWYGTVQGPHVVPLNPSPAAVVSGPVTFAPWLTGAAPGGSCDGYGANNVAAVTGGSCLSTAHPFVTVPVVFTRSDVSGARGASVKIQLSANLQLRDPAHLALNFHQGPWLTGFGTTFQVLDNGGGAYTVDQAILGTPCGATGAGTLFSVDVAKVPASPDGAGTIAVTAVTVRDCSNAPLAGIPGATASLGIDFTLPAAISDLAAVQQKSGNSHSIGTTNVTLTFTAPPTATSLEVYRAPFGGTSLLPLGTYPEFTGAAPSAPAYPPAAPWTLTSVANSGGQDNPGSRGVWYYVAFSKDACGNVSAVSNVTSGKLDYFLGDVAGGVSDCAGNNVVDGLDVAALGLHYGASLTLVDPLACLDVGPTTNGSVDARPVPDNRLDFEELMLYAINYLTVSTPQLAVMPAAASRDEFRLEAPASVTAGETFSVQLRFSGAGDLQGLSTQLGWDAAIAEPLSVKAGDMIASQDGVMLSARPGNADVALLGPGRGIAGDGVLATFTFRAKASGDPQIAVASSDARDANNQRVAFNGSHPALPTTTGLMPAMPNPSKGATTLAFSLARPGAAELAIFSVDGRRVRVLAKGVQDAGRYTFHWDGTDDGGQSVHAGVYFVRLQTAEGRFSRSLVLTQ